jgi:hypothetical protein
MNRREFFIGGSLLTAAPVLRERMVELPRVPSPPVGSAGEGNTVYDLQPVVKGVYAAIPRPHYVNNSNSAAINLGGCFFGRRHWLAAFSGQFANQANTR